jgi:hypothetical protein
MLAALTVVTLSSCRRVRTCCKLFMCVTLMEVLLWHGGCVHELIFFRRYKTLIPRWIAVVISLSSGTLPLTALSFAAPFIK